MELFVSLLRSAMSRDKLKTQRIFMHTLWELARQTYSKDGDKHIHNEIIQAFALTSMHSTDAT